MRSLVPESIGGVDVVIRRIDLPQKELSALANSIAEKGGVALVAGAGETARVVLASGDSRGSMPGRSSGRSAACSEGKVAASRPWPRAEARGSTSWTLH